MDRKARARKRRIMGATAGKDVGGGGGGSRWDEGVEGDCVEYIC